MLSYRVLVVLASVLWLAPSLLPAQNASADDLMRLRQELTRAVEAQNKYMAAEHEARVEGYQRLSTDMDAFEQALRKVQDELAATRKELAAIRQENADLKRQLTAYNTDLTARITAETNARVAGDKQLADGVARQLETVVAAVNRSNADAVRAANDAAAAAAQAARANPPSNPTAGGGAHFIYEVAKGDTLSGIATAAGVSVADIKTMNNLSSDTIRVGQKLKIPQK
jgi:LysM repeat protein